MQAADLSEADLRGAWLDKANLSGANLCETRYDKYTKWPEGFDPEEAGAILEDDR